MPTMIGTVFRCQKSPTGWTKVVADANGNIGRSGVVHGHKLDLLAVLYDTNEKKSVGSGSSEVNRSEVKDGLS